MRACAFAVRYAGRNAKERHADKAVALLKLIYDSALFHRINPCRNVIEHLRRYGFFYVCIFVHASRRAVLKQVVESVVCLHHVLLVLRQQFLYAPDVCRGNNLRVAVAVDGHHGAFRLGYRRARVEGYEVVKPRIVHFYNLCHVVFGRFGQTYSCLADNLVHRSLGVAGCLFADDEV